MGTNDWIGKVLSGRYQIEELIGQGGMSSVFKANNPNLKRVVAVKMIHSHLSSDPGFVNRFEEEAAAVANLRHPTLSARGMKFRKEELRLRNTPVKSNWNIHAHKLINRTEHRNYQSVTICDKNTHLHKWRGVQVNKKGCQFRQPHNLCAMPG
jgi:serine/threonine protein kinase